MACDVKPAVMCVLSLSPVFCTTTNRDRLTVRSPLSETTIAMASGGLSCEANGASSPHSKTAAASVGEDVRSLSERSWFSSPFEEESGL